jgi:putative addiction module component (TIGR02574 family)
LAYSGKAKSSVTQTIRYGIVPEETRLFLPRLKNKVLKHHQTCQKASLSRYFGRMSIAADKVAEVLALPEQDRAFLARQLIASLDDTVEADAETQWREVIDRRSREIEEDKVSCRPVEQVVQDIRNKLRARRQSS